jgi:hypothetical protein
MLGVQRPQASDCISGRILVIGVTLNFMEESWKGKDK